ncbi:MAG: hypothetical protein ACTS53_00790 [Candidatus Hodgkinia cicadicola]
MYPFGWNRNFVKMIWLTEGLERDLYDFNLTLPPLFLPNEVKLETLTNSKLKQTTTIAFERWTKSDLHERCVSLYQEQQSVQCKSESQSSALWIKLFYQTFEGRLNRLLSKRKPINRDYNEVTYFATERTNVMERWKSLTSDENWNNMNLIKVTNRRETSSEVRKITKTPNERFGNKSFVYKLNINRYNLNFVTVSKNVLSEDKTKDIKSTLTECSVG